VVILKKPKNRQGPKFAFDDFSAHVAAGKSFLPRKTKGEVRRLPPTDVWF
jgi:hypothetical protein